MAGVWFCGTGYGHGAVCGCLAPALQPCSQGLGLWVLLPRLSVPPKRPHKLSHLRMAEEPAGALSAPPLPILWARA
eukprot:366045-Chlamydomonas_euryale.AAC.19